MMRADDTFVASTKDLVARLPNFKSIQLLSDVLTNGTQLSEKKVDELLSFLAKTFVTDNKITIAIAAAFRKMLSEIVGRACDIKTFPIAAAQERMDRIKQTIIALSVCTPIASQIVPIAARFVSEAGQDVLSEAKSDPHVAKALLRLISEHPEVFRETLDYSALVQCLKLPRPVSSPTNDVESSSSVSPLYQGASKLPRHSSVVAATVATVMDMNDTEREKMETLSYRRSRGEYMDKESEGYESCLVQAQRIGIEATLDVERMMALTSDSSTTTNTFTQSSSNVLVGGILHERLNIAQNNENQNSLLDRRPYLLTKSIRTQIADLSAALTCPDRPILLQGPPGCGKSALLRHVASKLGQRGKLIELHLDESCDAKSLLGTYVCDETPGHFKYQPGVLTKAVREGFWIVIEDIDSAANEVLTAILPLLESRTLPHSGQTDTTSSRIHPAFRLLATSVNDANHGPNASIITNLFTRVTVNPLQDDELLNVLNMSCPGLGRTLLKKMLETYRSITKFCKLATLRDLMRWCARVDQSTLVDMSHAKRRRDLASKRKRDAEMPTKQSEPDDDEEREYFTDQERLSVRILLSNTWFIL